MNTAFIYNAYHMSSVSPSPPFEQSEDTLRSQRASDCSMSSALWTLASVAQQEPKLVEKENSTGLSQRCHSGGIPEKDVFPQKLHRVLDLIRDDGHVSVISWLPHGRAIKIHQPKAFAKDIVRPYFSVTKAPSFTRQLYIYGFKRVTSGVDRGAYYHPYFLRAKPELCKLIKREGAKQGAGRRGRKKEVPNSDPNFYNMPPPELAAVPKQHSCRIQPVC
eukprot:CAMPEP_0113586430 /NCGR_PEP_ID=MMETSP0015_2-20120614/34294_1 /TAXON_ID=2838 /ORGANISM="Odontella" /LENGTH=218 /DNA_ID=CAMNT_0000491869 /DNA_START=107 /DNA_END=763 /DNA_ORIENTATION=- /assembly_acc=CAM_ASM_000160